MPRWLYALLLFAPLALITELLHLPAAVVFAVSAISLVPLAGLIGLATEHLAHHLGPRAGGLLNATFGNAAELIITILAINRGLITLAKASITGSILGNSLLILGLALLAGGARHGLQRYDPRHASLNAAMMILAIAGLYLPATFATQVADPFIIEELSLLVAGVLLLTYLAYLWYTVVQGQPGGEGESERAAAQRPVASSQSPPSSTRAIPASEQPPAQPVAESHGGPVVSSGAVAWSTRKALLVLAGAVVGTAVVSEILVGAVEPVAEGLRLSEFFIGVIIVPLVGNAAEHFSAVQFAWRNRMEVTLAIAAGSSTQIALLVAPVLVFLSLLLGHPMNLIFEPMELLILGVTVAIFGYISLDGESNWLEGVQLLAIYLIAAIVFFFLPVSA